MKYSVSITMGCMTENYGVALIVNDAIGDAPEQATLDLMIGEPAISHRTANLSPTRRSYYAEVKLSGTTLCRKDAVKVGKICNRVMANYAETSVELNFQPIAEVAEEKTDPEVDEAEVEDKE